MQRTSVVGVVGDVRRDMEGHHYAERCSVFGITEEELGCLHRCSSFSTIPSNTNALTMATSTPASTW